MKKRVKELPYQEYNKVFYPTVPLILDTGIEALNSYHSDEEEASNIVVLTQSDINSLREAAGRDNEAGVRAREVLTYIQERMSIEVEKIDHFELSPGLDMFISGQQSIGALRNRQSGVNSKLEIVCNDEGEEISYRLQGLNAGVRRFDNVNPNIRLEGIRNIENDELYSELIVDIGKSKKSWPLSVVEGSVSRIFANQYFVIQPATKGSDEGAPIVLQALGDLTPNKSKTRYKMGDLEARLVPFGDPRNRNLRSILGIKPRDINQQIYLHALTQEHISLVIVTGRSSSGKTLLGYASLLEQTLRKINEGCKGERATNNGILDEKFLGSRFDKLYLTKPIDRIGGRERQQGYLKGDEQQKLEPLMRSYRDDHEQLDIGFSFEQLQNGFADKTKAQSGNVQEQEKLSKLRGKCAKDSRSGLYLPQTEGVLKIEDYSMWRGRTLTRAGVFLDEAQNLRPRELKDLLSRQGEGSVYIVSGDYENQIDNERSSTRDNALFQAVKYFLGTQFTAVVDLPGSYRGALAEHAVHWRARR